MAEQPRHLPKVPTPEVQDRPHNEVTTPPQGHALPPPRKNRPCRSIPHSKREDGNVAGFLRKLLPKDFDTGDLFVVLLLLLMAGDCAEEKNTALLTLALYFLM